MSSENSNISEKSPSESHAEVIVRMFPSDANPAGNVFGGEILKNIDMVAGIVAQRHSQSNAVTVSLDSVNFLKPVFVGNVLFLNARINYVHNSSMEIEVKAEAEDIVTGIRTVTATAFVNLKKNQNIEIMYLCQIYTPVIRRLIDESRNKIKELANWK